MTPTEQRAHIADGDYVWCETCGGEGIIRPDDMPAYQCGMCDGDGVVFCGDDDETDRIPALLAKSALHDAASLEAISRMPSPNDDRKDER